MYLGDNDCCKLFVKPEVSIAHLILKKNGTLVPERAGYYDLLTIPEAYRPKYDGGFMAYHGEDGNILAICMVSKDGAVRIFCKDTEPMVSPFGSYFY